MINGGLVALTAGSNTGLKHNWISRLDIDFLKALSWHQLQELNSEIVNIMQTKYRKRRTTKYGNMNKGFTEEEATKFFKMFADREKKEFLAFKMQALLGLRIGEAVEVKVSDISFDNKSILIHSEKTAKADELYLHDEIYKLLQDFIKEHKQQIDEHAGYVLFSENPTMKRLHLAPGYLRKKFREVCNRCNFVDFYDFADDYDNPLANQYKKGRKLYRLTTHSLRHYFVTRVYNSTKDPVTTSKLARHVDLATTQTYIHSSRALQDAGMKMAFG
ncbi:MAG: site-specific integrase [Candidatus Diapherotrites archaeon]|nr:site-specific integrase [Candidatus Diapherotrites archaeon]